MKKILVTVLVAAMGISLVSAEDITRYSCGSWGDVPSDDEDFLEEICEYGLMQGYNSEDFGYGDPVSRAEMAVIANRLVFSTDTYDDHFAPESDDYYYDQIVAAYSDVPENSEAYEWVHQAMFFAGDLDVEVPTVFDEVYSPISVMTGDDGEGLTTFRPFDDVNMVEMMKVLYEASFQAEILSESHEVSYDDELWYSEMLEQYESSEAVTTLDLDEQSIYLGDPIGVSYVPFSLSMDREDVAFFLYMMIENNLIDVDRLDEHIDGGWPKPDMRVKEITTDTIDNDVDGELIFSITVKNASRIEAEDFYVDYLIDDEVYGSSLWPALEPFEEYTKEFSIDAEVIGEGQFEFSVEIDPEDEIDEQKEHNNDDQPLDFVVGSRADLEIMMVGTTPEVPEEGEPFEIYVIVANLGFGPSIATDVVIYYNEENTAGRYNTVPALSSMEETTVTMQIEDGFSAGDYANDVILDPSAEVIESDEETGHAAVVEFTVQ